MISPVNIAASHDELAEALAASVFGEFYGFRLESIGEGQCTLLVPHRSTFERPDGIISGPVFMAAADVAMWIAIKTKLGVADGSVTAEMKTNFLSGARKENFRCSAKMLKCGNRLIYGVAECVNDRGTLLTHHTLTYIRQHGAAKSTSV